MSKKRWSFTALFITTFIFLSGSVAEAPTMLGDVIQQQYSLGYHPCNPVISQLPVNLVNEGVLADAATPGDPGVFCEIRFSINLKVKELGWISWHEVCHLSTSQDIYSDSISKLLEDPVHQHPLFTNCLSKRGGYAQLIEE